MTNVRSRSPARTLWDQHGSLVIMFLVSVMSFQLGREWQTRSTADTLQTVIQTQTVRQDSMALELKQLAAKYDELSKRVAAATKEVSRAAIKVEAITVDEQNGTKVEPVPKP